MRIRVAVPILLLSLCAMLAGLSLATAQQGPGRPHIDVSGPNARRLNIPPLSKLPGAPGNTGTLPVAPTQPATPGPAPAPAPGPTPGPQQQQSPQPQTPPTIPIPPPIAPTPPAITPRAPTTPFETGIEFEPMPPNARVTFNLEDADLPDLVRLISSITGKRFILPGSKARAIKATVYAPTKVTAAEAYQAFLSILQLNGMSVVPAGRYLKIVESAGIEGLPVATYTQGEATPADDRFITRMHHLENVPAEDVATLLGRFKSHEGNITAYAPTNTLIMTDMGSSIRRMLRIVEAIDIPRAGEQVWLEPVHYADATELATRLTEIFPVSEPGASGAPAAAAPRPAPAAPGPPGAGAAEGPSTVGSRAGEMRITKILADERTNSLVIIATERAYLRILEMVRALDIPLEGEGRVHVHYVQHGDAEDIAQALTSIVGGGGGASPAGGGPPGAPRPAGAAAAAAGGGTPFEGSVRISAHKPTNSLVITSSLHDYATLRNVIGRLDVERRQVFIEAVIMELQVKRGTKAGLSLHTGIPDTPAAGALSLFGFNARGSLGFPNPADQETLTGLALGVRGPAIQQATQSIGISIPAFGVVLNALSTAGDVNVLSTPHIMAMDNVEAEISVGADIPLQTNSGFGTAGLGALGAGAIPGQASPTAGLLGGALGALGGGLGGAFGAGAAARRKVGTKIHITPHINEANEIRLEIEEEISERQASEGTLGVVSVAERTAKTQVVVRDQQTVVIGGLMRDSVSTEETKVPILGDIPLLGILFRRTNRTIEKTNLLLFLTPYIIRSSADLRAIFERKMRERQEFIDRYFVFGDQEYTPPIDYSRTRGLLGEILNELAAIDDERRLLEEAAARPPPDHVPRSAVGAVERSTEPQPGDVVISPESPQGRVVSEDDVGQGPPQAPQPAPGQ